MDTVKILCFLPGQLSHADIDDPESIILYPADDIANQIFGNRIRFDNHQSSLHERFAFLSDPRSPGGLKVFQQFLKVRFPAFLKTVTYTYSLLLYGYQFI